MEKPEGDAPLPPGPLPEPGEIVLPPTEHPLAMGPVESQDAQEPFERLLLLYRLGEMICGETDLKKVFETILSAVVQMVDIERGFIAVLSEGRLIPRVTHGISLRGDPATWPVSSTMLERVLRDGLSLLTVDARQDAQYGDIRSVNLKNIRSVMCCPLGRRGGIRGLIYVDNRVHASAFSKDDLRFLTALSHDALIAIENAEAISRISRERELAEARLDALTEEAPLPEDLVGASRAITKLYGQVLRVSRKDVPVLLVGETGTGKEVFARLIHSSSDRARKPFIPVHIGALPKDLIESELFGHEPGAFTGAGRLRLGRFEIAGGGTLFLDEIQDIPLDVQPKLLRVLEQRTFERVGGNEAIQADVRIVCASNREPAAMVAEGAFREDLFYRLNAVTLRIPPLRERREDIVPLVRHFLKAIGSGKVFEEEAMAAMEAYDWPGNVRQLRNCVEAMDTLVDGPCIRKGDLPAWLPGSPPEAAVRRFEPLADVIARVEREHFERALRIADGSHEKAIGLLGISRAKYFQRKKEYGIGSPGGEGKAPV